MPVYLLTGANRGLGLELTRQLSSDPSNTVLACVRNTSTDLTALRALNTHSNIHILECDTSSSDSISALPAAVTAQLGATGGRIDYLLNNAGVNSAPEQDSLHIGPADLALQMRVNVLGPAQTVAALLGAALLGERVVVVNMTSGLGSCADSATHVPRQCATYSISKAALNMLTVHQAGDLRARLKGAKVVCMDPGWVKTSMGGEDAVLEPEESISGVLKTIHGLGDKDYAKYYRYDGEEVPW
ncbi:hypothetical protein MBLNU459_g4977t1 [Dothideomycetes sp. NU459]